MIERAVILSRGGSLLLDLPDSTLPALQPASSAQAPLPTRDFLTDDEMKLRQRENLVAALAAADWRIAGEGGAAELLGLKPSTLADRMRSMGLRRPARQ